MDNPEKQAISGTRHRTKTITTKITTPKNKMTSNTDLNKKKQKKQNTGKTRGVQGRGRSQTIQRPQHLRLKR